MAIMYPKNIELYNPTDSERKVYFELKNQLPDTYSVYYSVAWVRNFRGSKEESEADFIIFNENNGFITCEVKGGHAYKYENGKFLIESGEGTMTLKRSPMQQAEESSRYFFDLFVKTYNIQFKGTYGSVAVFPFYTVNNPVLLDHRTKDTVIDFSDMNDLENKIKKVFKFYKSKNPQYGRISKEQALNFKEMIHKEIASEAAAGAIITAKEYEIRNLNRIQNNLVEFLSNHNRTFIKGGAGTGKTWIAMKFAIKSALNNAQVLLTTMNERLILVLKNMLKGYENIKVCSFNELLKESNVDGNQPSENIFELISSLPIKKYDSLIVDEAQDFDEYQALTISQFLKNSESELRVFYDVTQNIYNRDFKNGFDIQDKPYVLYQNLRNTESVYDWASRKTNLGSEVTTNQILGPAPLSYRFAKRYNLKQFLETQINAMISQHGVPISSIAIIVDHECYPLFLNQYIGRFIAKDKLKIQDLEIKLSLVENYKGLESDVVFYIHKNSTTDSYDYVAYTRAKYYLFELIDEEN